MLTANYKIVGGFSFPTISPIIGASNYETIAEVHLKLNSNAASILWNLVCCTLGLLQLTISPAVYATLRSPPSLLLSTLAPIPPSHQFRRGPISPTFYTPMTSSPPSSTITTKPTDPFGKCSLPPSTKCSSSPSAINMWDTAPPPPTPF